MRPERRKGGRRRTDRQPPSDTRVTLTNEQSAGAVRHDDRGEAVWAWETEQHDPLERTFDELKALDNEALSLLEADPGAPRPPAGGGYNPYDASTGEKPKRKTRS